MIGKSTAMTVSLGLGLYATASPAIMVTADTDATALANALLGTGVTLSGTPTFTGGTGSTVSAGTFTGGLSSGIGIDSGVVLTTGDVSNVDNANSDGETSADFGGGGDDDLQSLIPEHGIHDATLLEFDFTTTTGDLFFQYAFASEEYNEYVDSEYNDVFGFFVDGVNIAIAPNGEPVSINNVNCGNPFAGAGPNCDSFNDNELHSGAAPFNFEYDGFTDVFTAKALGLGVGQHTIKLAIGDAGDSRLDSGVFLAGSSFSPTAPPGASVPEPAALSLLALGLVGLSAQRMAQRR